MSTLHQLTTLRDRRHPRSSALPIPSTAPWLRALLAAATLCLTAPATAATLLSAGFDAGEDGFAYIDDPFLNTIQPNYAAGDWQNNIGNTGGGLRVVLGGIDGADINDMSGGWAYTLDLTEPAQGVVLSFGYNLTQTGTYESDEYSRVLVSVDGALYGGGDKPFVDHIGGDGQSGDSDFSAYSSGVTAERSTGWLTFQVFLGDLGAGAHEIVIGGYNNKKTLSDESTEIRIDDVLITSGNPEPEPTAAQSIIDRLGPSEVAPADWQPMGAPGNAYTQFKSDIYTLSNFCGDLNGTEICDRYNMHTGPESASFVDAKQWVVEELEALGYTVERHAFFYSGNYRENVYATKVGETNPDQMYIVSCHLDGRGHERSGPSGAFTRPQGGAADDDASGCALVLAAARAFAADDVTTGKSIRFMFWNNEETGFDGSEAYRNDRNALRGVEEPAGSGLYPEPDWLGIIQHDMILFDHGDPAQPDQIQGADIDVEYRPGTTFAAQSKALTEALKAAAGRYNVQYPAEIGDFSEFTDDKPFWNFAPSVSVRENRRCCEISNNHPYYHNRGDLYENYSEDDYRLGFDTVRMTIGAVAQLAGASVGTNMPPTADALSVSVAEDSFVAMTLTGADDDGDTLTFAIASLPANGGLTGTPPNLTYTPNPNYFGTDDFSFTVNDGKVDSDPATVTINVTPVNDPPVAFDQLINIAPGETVAITLTGDDPDGDPLDYAVFGTPDGGTLSGTPPTLSYTANDGFIGTDTIAFSVTDSAGSDSDLAFVDIVVAIPDDPPVAESASVTTSENTPVAITLVGSDPNGDTLFYEVLTFPARGTLAGLEPNLTYTPAPGYSGADSFSFRVLGARDGDGDGEFFSEVDSLLYSEPATVAITVEAVNDPPTADSLAVVTQQGTPVDITLSGSDPDGDTLAFTVIDSPTNGTLSGAGSVITYTPDGAFVGADSFTYQAGDGQLSSAVAGVSITVAPAGPVVVFADDFETDKGWTRNPNDTDNALTGLWERADPQPTASGGVPLQLGDTVSGSQALVTGALAGSSVGSNDIDRGVTSIRSPLIALPADRAISLSLSYYLAHLSNASDADFLRVSVVGVAGTTTVLQELGANNTDAAAWEGLSISLDAFAGQTIALLIEAADNGGGSLVEAAVDDVQIVAGAPADTPLLSAGFDGNAEGFTYQDDSFRGTSAGYYARGDWDSAYGDGGGGLRVLLGGRDNSTVRGMSGGWQIDFTLDEARQVSISARVNLTQSSEYEDDEYSDALLSVDGALYGQGGEDYLARIVGNGNGGSARSTGWQTYQVDVGTLAAGTHRLVIGGYNNKKTYNNEATEVRIDGVVISTN